MTQTKGSAPERTKGEPIALDGAKAVARAMRQLNPDVVAAYPITPQTEIVQTFSEYVANGEVDTEFIAVESEHAAMSACIGAAAAGGRVQTATTSAGMAFMWEMLYIAASLRLPIIMAVANRALSGPLNIHCDHSDAMGARDSGWIQIFGEDVQEAYDNAIQALRIAEHPDVMLPVMHCQDGFITSHGVERMELIPDDAVRGFIGTYKTKYSLLDTNNPVSFGPVDLQDYYFEHKRQQIEGMEKALTAIEEIGREFGDLTGRYYGHVAPYRLEDAEIAIVVMSSTAGTAKIAVDNLRSRGVKAGLLKVRTFRPFPAKAVVDALSGIKAVAVLDRAVSFGAQGNPLFHDLCTAMYVAGARPSLANYVFGLGGRDTTSAQLESVYSDLVEIAETGKVGPVVRYLGLRD